MKIGILTFHRACNCGAMLQAWALRRFLQEDGHQVGFLRNHIGEWSRWDRFHYKGSILRSMIRFANVVLVNLGTVKCRGVAIARFKRFREKYLPEVDVLGCDVIVEGSDQVWRPSLTAGETDLFRGVALPGRVRKISYAASFGDKPLNDADAEILAESLKCYSALSVREPLVKDQIQPLLQKKIELVVDPTLLVEADDYAEIANSLSSPVEPYLFAYAIHATPQFVRFAKMIAKTMGLKLVVVAAAKSTRWRAPVGLTYGVSPDRMIGCLRKAECVIAASFHGTALSALHGKPFVSYREDGFNAQSRPVSFLRRIGEEFRVVGPTSDVQSVVVMLKKQVGATALKRIDELRSESRDWLRRALLCIEDFGDDFSNKNNSLGASLHKA